MHVSGLLFMVMALAVPTLAFSQTTSKTVSQTPPVAASTGALAIESDVGGTLFIDGQKRSVIVVGKIAVSNLMPGQHIVELHDDKGNVLWKETETRRARAEANRSAACKTCPSLDTVA